MIDTRESDVAPAVAARFGALHETRQESASAAAFVETEASKVLAESGFGGSHPAPTTLPSAVREAKSLLPRTNAERKIFDNPRGGGSRICNQNVALTVARRTSGCAKFRATGPAASLVATKNFDQPAIVSSGNQRREFASATPTLQRLQAVAMTRNADR